MNNTYYSIQCTLLFRFSPLTCFHSHIYTSNMYSFRGTHTLSFKVFRFQANLYIDVHTCTYTQMAYRAHLHDRTPDCHPQAMPSSYNHLTGNSFLLHTHRDVIFLLITNKVYRTKYKTQRGENKHQRFWIYALDFGS